MLGNLRTAFTMSLWILPLVILAVAESVIAGENDPYGSGFTPTFGPTKFHWLPPPGSGGSQQTTTSTWKDDEVDSGAESVFATENYPYESGVTPTSGPNRFHWITPPGSSGSQQSTTNPWSDDEVESLVAALKQGQGATPPQVARPSSAYEWGYTGTSDLSGAESVIASENDPYGSRVTPTYGPTKFHSITPPGSSGSQQSTTSYSGNTGTPDLSGAKSAFASENDPYESRVTPTSGPTMFQWITPLGSSGSQQTTTTPWKDDEVDSGAESAFASENDPYESRVTPTSGPTMFQWITPPGSSGSQQSTTSYSGNTGTPDLSGFVGTGGQATEGIPQQQAPAGWGRFPLSRGNPPPRPQYQSSDQESSSGVTGLLGSGGYNPVGSSSTSPTYKDEEVTKEDTLGYLFGSSPPLANYGSEDAYKPTGSSPTSTYTGGTPIGSLFGSSAPLANHGSEGGYTPAGSFPTFTYAGGATGPQYGSSPPLANHGSEKQYTFRLPPPVDDKDEDDTPVSVHGPSTYQAPNAEKTFTNFPKIPAPGVTPPQPTTGQQPWSSYEEERYSDEDQFSYTP